MAVFQEQDHDQHRFVIRPNCALSWRTTKVLIWFFGGCLAAVSLYFVSLGAWVVLPFAGLEFAVLAAGFYASALAGHSREIVEIRGPVVRVLRGGRRLKEAAGFPVNWTQVVLERDPTGWYPSRLWLRSHGRELEIAAKIVETEREELAAALKERLGFALAREDARGGPPDRKDTPEGARSTPVPLAQDLPGGRGAFFGGGVGIEGDAPVPEQKKTVRFAGSDFL